MQAEQTDSQTARELQAEIDLHAAVAGRIVQAVEQVVVGQRSMVESLLIGLFTGGHVLVEGVPGLAKTLTISTLARTLHAQFSRIQFTPDLLPADLIGTLIYNPKDHTFTPRKGPIFTNLLLADEINRAPAKVQSALLEAMQERHVTIGDTTYRLEQPFLVLATMNPIEQEGTYHLPEAQVDRFMFKLTVSYPSREEERAIIDRMATTAPSTGVSPVVEVSEIFAVRALIDRIFVDPRILDYVVRVVHATRRPAEFGLDLAPLIEFGVSPRASINLVLAARAHAFLRGRAFVTPADIKAVGHSVMRHRLVLTYEAQARGVTADDVVAKVFGTVPVP